MTIKLKIKSKSLATESKIIRKEEIKLSKILKWEHTHEDLKTSNTRDLLEDLSSHRRWDLRLEARSTQLALAFLKGQEYSKVEKKRKVVREPEFKFYTIPLVLRLVNKYGPNKVTKEDLEIWSKVEQSSKVQPQPVSTHTTVTSGQLPKPKFSLVGTMSRLLQH